MKKTSLLFLNLIALSGVFAQQKQTTPKVIDTKITVLTPIEFKETQALNLLYSQDKIDKMKFKSAKEMNDREHRIPQTFKFKSTDGPEYGNDPLTIQRQMGTTEPLAVLKKWNGQTGGYQPEDPTGAVGLTQYVQSVNATPFAVYNKSGTGTSVFTGSIGTITGTGTDGDPIVNYDKFADRWIVTQMNGSSGMGIAVSKTNDPSGAWSAYKFTFSAGGNDYIKFSVWPDGYYMTGNTSGNILIFERTAMIAGNAGARAIQASYTEPTNAGFGFFLALSGDADGIIPPSGERCPLFGYTDNAWGGSEIDGVKVWSVGTTWGTTPSANVTLDATIPTAAFDASYDANWNDITQPGTQKLDGLGGVCMFRAQWNSFVGTNRVVLNWAVKLSSTQRSIKWVELRQDQSSKVWSLYQEGIYTPDASNRWCGSIAMDCHGDIALCYAVTSSSVSPSLAYTGRVPGDPLGTMSLAETVVFAGTGSISGSNRFGDYSHTSLDPSDGTTFWHTGMYSKSGSATGIYSFQIDPSACVVGVKENSQDEIQFTTYQSGSNLNVNVTRLPSNDFLFVELFDVSGKKISSKKVNPVNNAFETTVNVDGLSSGVYFVRIGAGDCQRVKKVVLQ